MSNKREVMINALAALEDVFGKHKIDVGVINQLRDALAEPEQEPVAYILQTSQDSHKKLSWSASDNCQSIPLYTSPQPREWQELSEDDVIEIGDEAHRAMPAGCEDRDELLVIYTAISASLRAKNGG